MSKAVEILNAFERPCGESKIVLTIPIFYAHRFISFRKYLIFKLSSNWNDLGGATKFLEFFSITPPK